MSAEKAK
ncbi:hypothetical protein VTH06DRAFT_7266 [Thermothelomyces fergusii]